MSEMNSIKKGIRRGSLALVGMALLAGVAHAQIPSEISYQAYLTDSAGVPILSNNVVVEIDFYDDENAGTLLDSFSSTPLDLGVTRGFVNINVPVALTGEELDNTIWIEVTVDGETLSPRQQLVASPQALNAARVGGLAPSQIVIDGGNQTVSGEKTFTDIFEVNVAELDTSASGEEGAAISARAGTDADAARAIGVRGRVLQTNPEPATLPGGTRVLQGVVGAVSGDGGLNTTLGGGYFNANLLGTSTTGAQQVTGVSADAQVQSGATTAPGSLLVGGRFGANNANAGDMVAFGVIGTAASATPTNQGAPAIGIAGFGAGSQNSNLGVLGGTNVSSEADLLNLAAAVFPLVPEEGVGVLAHNADAGGYALRAVDQNGDGTALDVIGSSTFTGNVAVTGTVTSSQAPVNPEDLVRKDYVDAEIAAVSGGGGGPFVDLDTNQAIAGEKTFTEIMEVNVSGIETSVSGETGSALNVRTTPDADAGRAIGIRGRVQQNGPEPATLPSSTRPIQGIVGIALGDGGANTTLGGGYFFSRLQAAAAEGAISVSGVSADAAVESGATTAVGQNLVGGRFGADNVNAGNMSSIGVLATAAPGGTPTGTHVGPAIGALALGAGSVSHNIGVVGMANADPITAFPGIAGDLPAAGVGVFAYNENAGGVALRAKDQNDNGTALSVIGATTLEGDVAVTGTVTSTEAPVNPEDLTRKDYVDNQVGALEASVNDSFSNLGRVLWVVPSGGASTPDGTLAAPFDDIAAAYAEAQTMGPNFFNRVAIMLAPGQHTLTSTLTMDTVGIDLMGFGEMSVFLNSSADPAIAMTAGTSGAVIRNLNLQAPNGSSNVLVDIQGGRLVDVALRRSGGGGTLARVNTVDSGSVSTSFRRFEIYGDVQIDSAGQQTTFTDGFISGTVNSTATGSGLLGFTRMSGVGAFNLTQAGPALLALSNIDLVGGISYPDTTVVQISSTNFINSSFVVQPVPEPASGSTIINSLGDTADWVSAGAIESSGNVPMANFNVLTAMP